MTVTMNYQGVTIPEAKGPFVQHFLYFFRREHESLWNTLREMTAEQMDWQPAKEAFSVVSIVEHLLATERILLEADLLQQPIDTNSLPSAWHLWGRDKNVRSGHAAAVYLADLEASCQRVLDFAAELDDTALQRMQRLWDGKREQKVMERLQILIGHLLYHHGQIIYITLLDGFPGSATTTEE
jgi:uncharacterized damage-inducible protein DinB